MTRNQIEILIATSNEGKAREIKCALTRFPLTILTLRDFPSVQKIEETGETYEENAISKAVEYSAQTGLYAIADDSGMEVSALGGRPGVFSARYGGTGLSDSERNQRLLSSLANTDSNGRAARFVSVAVLAQPPEGNANAACVLAVTKGICAGAIAFSSRGEHGFGYDSIFIPNGHDQTFGELADSIKNEISHRAQCIMQLQSVVTYLLEQP
jgi:XTP/dITP diphosphohydrolase